MSPTLFWLCIFLSCLQGAYIIIKVSHFSQETLQRVSSATVQSPHCSLCIKITLMQSYKLVLSSSPFTWDYKRITGPDWEESPSETYCFSSLWGYTSSVVQPQLVLLGMAVSIFWAHEATSGAWTPPFYIREGEICRLTRLMVRLHCWQDDSIDNCSNMMSSVGLGQLMNNEDVALVEKWRYDSDQLVFQLFVLPHNFHIVLLLHFVFVKVTTFLFLKGLQVLLVIIES